ncbi:major facilitator superfamily transporter [Pseudohyphozyma bogoriensis]|nr:major facilitator superfamily transporter [Pseudohyphozyma bogoriensis]
MSTHKDLEAVKSGGGEVAEIEATGDVNLIADGEDVVLVPTPTSDPRVSCFGLTVVSGAGSIVSFFYEDYVEDGYDLAAIVRLITIPTLSMGLGNLIFMPIALAIGRRPVYIFSCALLFIGCIIAGQNTDYKYHMGIRVVIGFAAGQSEALVPLMLKEAFFLHERGKILAFQSSFQATIACVLSIFTSNMAAAYNLYAGMSGFVLIASFFLVPETKFDRPLESYNGLTATTSSGAGNVTPDEKDQDSAHRFENATVQYTLKTRPPVDAGPSWSWKATFNPLPTQRSNWPEAWALLKHMGVMILFPNVLLIVLMNSWFLGVNIGVGTSYATLLNGPVYHWATKWSGVAQTGQIVISFIVFPTLGTLSDRFVKYMAKRRGGVHHAEVRLVPLILPIIVGTFSSVLFGYTYENPTKVHWFSVVFTYCGIYYAFVAASVCGITYLLDAYPTRSGSVLTLICAIRGIISFGINYSLDPTYAKLGYLGAYGMYAGVMGFLGIGAISMFWTGASIRARTQKYIVDDSDGKPRYG